MVLFVLPLVSTWAKWSPVKNLFIWQLCRPQHGDINCWTPYFLPCDTYGSMLPALTLNIGFEHTESADSSNKDKISMDKGYWISVDNVFTRVIQFWPAIDTWLCLKVLWWLTLVTTSFSKWKIWFYLWRVKDQYYNKYYDVSMVIKL